MNNDGLIWNPEEAMGLVGELVFYKDGVYENWKGPESLLGITDLKKFPFEVQSTICIFIKPCNTESLTKQEAEAILSEKLGNKVTIRDKT
jgi:hypothetical protein